MDVRPLARQNPAAAPEFMPQPQNRKPAPPRVDELDGLRGMLALWVAISHIVCWCGFSLFPLALPHVLRSTANGLWQQFSYANGAVDTFIILSGFAISFMLHARPQTYGQFMTGRFFRIYPVYLLCLLAGLFTVQLMPFVLQSASWHDADYFSTCVRPVLESEQARPKAHLLSHFTLLYGLIPNQMLPNAIYSLLAPAWSITLEWQYYLLAPLLAWLVCRPSGLILLGVVCCGSLVYERYWSGSFLLQKLPLFLVGIGSFQLYTHAPALRRFAHRPFVFAGLLLAILAVQWHWVALLVWLGVFGAVLADPDQPAEQFLLRPRRWLLSPAWQFIGKISYPLYLVHWPVIIGLLAGLISWCPGISQIQALAILLVAGLPVIVLSAWLLHRWVEKPLMRYGKKFA